MKKKILGCFLVIILCFCLVGCGKKKNNTEEWIINMEKPAIILEDDLVNTFNKAMKNYQGTKLELVALLGQQVVAGTNYMFLCQSEDSYKVVIVYKDLEGKASVLSVTDFDVKKYVNENKSLDAEMLAGGWYTTIPGKPIVLEEKVQNYFDKAIEKIVGVSYFPITVLAHQNKVGTNYAVLCYGRLSDHNATEGIFVLTLYVDETNKPEIVAISSVDLKEFHQ